MSYSKIIMTGGGSAGHVTPNLALIPRLKELGYEIQYIGTEEGIERNIIENQNIKYHIISSGKLRRYLDVKNFTDPFKVIKGVFQAFKIIKDEKPNIVFSKGGFVSVPVVLGAYFNKIPVISHESDLTPGLANKIAAPYSTKVCVTFPESLKKLSVNKGVLTGTPIREELLKGSAVKGLNFCGFKADKPLIMVIGGSLGSKYMNEVLRKSLLDLIVNFNIVHICGRNNIDEGLKKIGGYVQFEYVTEELPDILAAADIVVSRAGANAIFEILALKKPNILIPLSKKSSRGDQILNAESFKKSGYSIVIQEEVLNEDVLIKKIDELFKGREEYINKMKKNSINNSVEEIVKLIEKYKK